MFWKIMNFGSAVKNINCPSCGAKSISQIMLVGGNEAKCENCNSISVSPHYKKQRIIGLMVIISCVLPFLNILFLPIPFLAFILGGKFDLKSSKFAILKPTDCN